MTNSLCIAGMAVLLTAYAAAATSAARYHSATGDTFECLGADLANKGARLALSLGEEWVRLSGASGALCRGHRMGESREFERFDGKGCGAEYLQLSKSLHSEGAGSLVLAHARPRGAGYSYRRFNCAQ